ncbi:MAG TPA: hypothetical protein VKZ53_19585 [Candidatus Angelobacter sp.]|nr:hypothetical protein [Candidatus Angelobacter sp.]
MKSKSLPWTLALFCASCLGLFGKAQAQVRDIVVPAGTLLQCTLDEPKFSSATITAEDPFLCYPRAMQQFGQTVFPRGSYIVGHLEKAKDPGHFVGKGYLKLEFDRIGLPATDVPLNAKIIAVAHYNVDREGKIIGHGHATRDTVEWLMPPLWPWKVLTLPARGPRPTLKGETRVTMRVMADIVVPQALPPSAWRQPSAYKPQGMPQTKIAPEPAFRRYGNGANAPAKKQDGGSHDSAAPSGSAATQTLTASASPVEEPSLMNTPADVTLFSLRDGTTLQVRQYWIAQDQLSYMLAEGNRGTVPLGNVNWSATARLNAPRDVRVTLTNFPPKN